MAVFLKGLPLIATWCLFWSVPAYLEGWPAYWGIQSAVDAALTFAFIMAISIRPYERRISWWLCLLSAAILMGLLGFTAGSYFVQNEWQRPLRLGHDWHYLKDLWVYWQSSHPERWLLHAKWTMMLAVLFIMALVAGLIGGLVFWFEKLTEEWSIKRRALGFMLAAISLAIVGIGMTQHWQMPSFLIRNLQTPQIIPTEVAASELIFQRLAQQQNVTAKYLVAGQKLFDQIRNYDVTMIELPAYSDLMYTPGPYYDLLREDIEGLEQDVQDSGYFIASRFMQSPAADRDGDLAAFSLACGTMVNDRQLLRTLQHTSLHCDADFFHRAHYATLSLQAQAREEMPSRYDRHLTRQDLQYEGALFDGIPSQFVFARWLQSVGEIREPKKPVFSKITLAASSWPWQRVPSYLEDWSSLTDKNGEIYLSHPPTENLQPLAESAVHQGYVEAMRYEFQVLRHLIRLRAQHPTIYVIYGLQQPWTTDGQTEMKVPVHFFAPQESLIEPLLAKGYKAGLIPTEERDTPLISEVLGQMLTTYSSLESDSLKIAKRPRKKESTGM